LVKARTVEPLLDNGCITRNNKVNVGSGVFFAVRAEAIYKGDPLPLWKIPETELGVRWTPACEDVCPEAEDVTKLRSEDRD
jgi:hypothetical protein